MQQLPQANPKSFVEDLLAQVDDLVVSGTVPRIRGEGTHWTHSVKYWLDKQGEELGFRSIYTDRNGMSEFLLDFVWWDKKAGKSSLACEMEWGNSRDVARNAGRVAEDFDKLLSFKASCKLMLFDSRNDRPTQKSVLDELKRYLREYGDHRIGEFYLLVDVSGKLHQGWKCSIQRDGKDSSLEFSEL